MVYVLDIGMAQKGGHARGLYYYAWENDARYLNCSQQNPSPAHWFSKDHAVKKLQLHGRVGGLIYHHTPLQFYSK